MKILNVLLVGVALIAGMTSVSAQEKSKKSAQERAELHTERMSKALNLTSDQRAKVAELNLGIAMKNDAIRNNTEMSKELKMESIKANNEARKTYIKTILTEEQLIKFEEHEAKMQAKKEAKKAEVKKKKVEQKESAPVEELEEL